MYLELVSVSMKSQCFEVPAQASVLFSSSSAAGMHFSRQSKSVAHLDAATSKQWWMFKEVFELPAALKEQKLKIKLYASTGDAASESTADSPGAQSVADGATGKKLLQVSTSSLELCIGHLDLSLSALHGSDATTFEVTPVSLAPTDSKDRGGHASLLKRSITSTITLRLLSQPPPRPPNTDKLDTVAVREEDRDEDPPLERADRDEVLLGTVRVVIWQGKNLSTDYPVFLDCRMNQKAVRRYVTMPVANPHNPIFDIIQDFDILSLQGDLFVSVVTDHSLRANKPMGQVIIPLSMLTNHMTEYESAVSISGWFELFPHNKVTKYNGGGKYIPYLSDIPLASSIDNCIGLPVPDKSLGFIKLDVTLQLHHSLMYTILRNPFCLEEKPQITGIDEEDALDLFDIYVTKHNFYRIMDTLTNPLWFSTFKDIIHWKHHFGVTFFTLFLYGYTCLLAEAFMFPFIFVVFIIFVGLVASCERSYHDQKLFVDEKAQSTKQSKIDEGNSKSLAERFKGMKQSVNKMELKVRQLASHVEKLNNLLLWSDPTLSLTALFFLLVFTLAASILLSIIPFHLCFFFGGLVVFIPQEAMGRLKKMKRMATLMWQRMKAERKVRFDKVLPEGTFLTQLRSTHLEETMTGHILSGDLCSQTWSGSVPAEALRAGGHAKLNSAVWTRKWCELWAVPGVLKISDPMSLGEEDKPPALYDVTYVSAQYIGKSSRNPPAASEGSSGSTEDDLYLFEISYLKGKKAELLKQTVWPDHQTSGWVFACSSYGDAQTWINAINRVTYRVSYRSILCGEDFHNPFSKRRNRSLLSKVIRTLWRWVMLVPDNWELQHRYFCEQAYVRSNYTTKMTSVLGKPSEMMSNNDMDVVNVSTKRNIIGHTEAVRFLSVGYKMKSAQGGSDDAVGEDSSPPSSGIHVSLFRARGLKVKNTQSKAKGWLLATTIPKIYVNLTLSLKEECGLVLKTGGQPRTSEPVFREDFFFPDVDFDVLLENNATLDIEVSVRTPMAFGLSSDYIQILGRIQIPLRPWIEQKLARDKLAAGGNVTNTEGSDGPRSLRKRLVKSQSQEEGLDDVRWFNLVSHTVIVGEVQMQITCL